MFMYISNNQFRLYSTSKMNSEKSIIPLKDEIIQRKLIHPLALAPNKLIKL